MESLRKVFISQFINFCSKADAEKCIGHFLCIFCGKHFNDSVKCDQHIEEHLPHQNCSSCKKPVVLIGNRLYELHVPQKCLARLNQSQIYDVTNGNDLLADVITSIDETRNVLNNEFPAEKQDVGDVRRRATFKKRGSPKLERIDIVESVDVDPIENVWSNVSVAPVQCDMCDAKFKLMHSLTRHLQRKHQIAPEYKCGICDLVFKHPTALTNHKLVHATNQLIPPEDTMQSKDKPPPPIKCNLCPTKFKIQHTLTRHMHQKHNIIPEYKCEICGIVCKKYQYLKDHLLTHGAVKRWICSWCGAGYHLKNNLKEHENGHTGARPYNCADCDKSFSRKALLRAHSVQHTGERPFKCPVNDCPRSYAYYTDLTRHKRGTHGIMSKPHVCSICDRVFYERKFLRKHMETHMLPSK